MGRGIVTALLVVAGGIGWGADAPTDSRFPYAEGPAAPGLETLELYECPAWFRDAKFGIRTQWGPQSVPELGDGYARDMHIPGRRANRYHAEHFGPPETVGYEAVIARWTAEKFDPAALVDRFAAAGAKYVVALAADRDGFDLWDSSLRENNAVKRGPGRDVVGAWAAAVRAKGLRFGVSEHRAGPGAAEAGAAEGDEAQVWYGRMRELIDLHRPDLVYTVGPVDDEARRHLMTHLYNRTIAWHDDLTGVFAARAEDCAHIARTGVETIPRGSREAIAPQPWQCDTALNDWVYDRAMPMRPAGAIIRQLADVVAKNGNLLLNVPLRADGSLPDDAGAVLDEIGAWLAVNGEAIFNTRPWRIAGEGPTATVGGPDGEKRTLPYTPEDIRYTARTWYDDHDVAHETVYAIVLGWPGPREEVILEAWADKLDPLPIGTVRLLGYDGALRIVRDRVGLHILLPDEAPNEHAIVFRID